MSFLSRLRRVDRPASAADATTELDPGARAALCIVGSGPAGSPLLHRWVEHHAGLVGSRALLLVLWGDRPADLAGLGCAAHVLPPGVTLGEPARWRMANRFAQALLSAYDHVAAVGVDELLEVDESTYPSVHAMLDRRGRAAAIAAAGYTLVARPDELAGAWPGGHTRLRRDPSLDRPVIKATESEWEAEGRRVAGKVATDQALRLIRVTLAG